MLDGVANPEAHGPGCGLKSLVYSHEYQGLLLEHRRRFIQLLLEGFAILVRALLINIVQFLSLLIKMDT